MNWKELPKQIHQAQKEAGWYDNYRSDNTLLLLIKSEVFEAFEAYRKAKTIKPLSLTYLNNVTRLININTKAFKEEFELEIKDSLVDELADVVIRTLDFAGYKGLDIIEEQRDGSIVSSNIETDFVNLDSYITNLYNSEITGENIGYIVSFVGEMCGIRALKLSKHIELKLAYNKTRAKRHGDKKI